MRSESSHVSNDKQRGGWILGGSHGPSLSTLHERRSLEHVVSAQSAEDHSRLAEPYLTHPLAATSPVAHSEPPVNHSRATVRHRPGRTSPLTEKSPVAAWEGPDVHRSVSAHASLSMQGEPAPHADTKGKKDRHRAPALYVRAWRWCEY